MTVKEFYIQNKKIFPLLSHGVIVFLGRKVVIDQNVGQKGTIYLTKHEQDSFENTDSFDHYFDLVPYDEFEIRQYSINKFVTYPLNKNSIERVEFFITLKVYGKKITQKEIIEKSDEF